MAGLHSSGRRNQFPRLVSDCLRESEAIPLTRCTGEGRPDEDGPIEPSVPREQVRQEPYPLPPQLVWSSIDMEDPEQVRSSLPST